MVTGIIGIYLMIGVAYWLAHVIQCRGCQGKMLALFNIFGEALVMTLGWPIDAYNKLTTPKEPDIGQGLLAFERKPGETMDQMIERAKAEFAKQVGIDPKDIVSMSPIAVLPSDKEEKKNDEARK